MQAQRAPRNLDNFKVNIPGAVEAVKHSLYDFQAYAAAGQTELIFFQVPRGQATKTQVDTNMEQAGSLPSPKSFLIQSIEVFFYSGAAINVAAGAAADIVKSQADDLYALHKSGYLDLFIGSKSFLKEAPLGKFAAQSGLDVRNSMAGTTTADTKFTSSNYARMYSPLYRLEPNITLQSTQNFSVGLYWPVAVAMPSAAIGRIGVALNGIMYRLGQ